MNEGGPKRSEEAAHAYDIEQAEQRLREIDEVIQRGEVIRGNLPDSDPAKLQHQATLDEAKRQREEAARDLERLRSRNSTHS